MQLSSVSSVDCYSTINKLRIHSGCQTRVNVWGREEVRGRSVVTEISWCDRIMIKLSLELDNRTTCTFYTTILSTLRHLLSYHQSDSMVLGKQSVSGQSAISQTISQHSKYRVSKPNRTRVHKPKYKTNHKQSWGVSPQYDVPFWVLNPRHLGSQDKQSRDMKSVQLP